MKANGNVALYFFAYFLKKVFGISGFWSDGKAGKLW